MAYKVKLLVLLLSIALLSCSPLIKIEGPTGGKLPHTYSIFVKAREDIKTIIEEEIKISHDVYLTVTKDESQADSVLEVLSFNLKEKPLSCSFEIKIKEYTGISYNDTVSIKTSITDIEDAKKLCIREFIKAILNAYEFPQETVNPWAIKDSDAQ